MAGSHTRRLRGGPFAAVLALSVCLLAGPALAQDPSPPVPPTGIPAQNLADLFDSESPTPEPNAGLLTVPQPLYDPAPDAAPTAPRVVVLGIFDTITESIFGQRDPDDWRPLPLSTLFSEGWNEAWVPSPNGSGGAPRQGWINAADANMYRLWFFTFAQTFNQGPKGNAYLGGYTLLTPLSRRLLLTTNIPFVLRNSASSGLPIISPSGLIIPPTKDHTTFGDISFTPRVLLHETKDLSLTAEVAALVPTGHQPLAGKTALTPAVGFWNNFAGRWVIRGRVGDYIPLGGGGPDTLISELAIGQTMTDHDAPLFGDFTWYLSTVVNTPLRDGQLTSVTLTPGIRTHVGHDWYFLAGLPMPVTAQRTGDISMIFWFMKAW
jgi:hypothetical protein